MYIHKRKKKLKKNTRNVNIAYEKARETWWNRPVRKGLSTFHRGVEGHEGVESISAKLYLNFEIGFQTLNCKNSCRNLTNSKARERVTSNLCKTDCIGS